jgi:3',5'-nucleoside bisphosphate phosphatase
MSLNTSEEPKGVADCHCHTHYSDGTFTPTEVIERAHHIGLKAIAITDHDCTDGLKEGKEAAEKIGIELIPGIEISAFDAGREIHVLGLYINPDDPSLKELTKRRRKGRTDRLKRTLDQLKEKENIEISIEDVLAMAGKGMPGRLHLARVLAEKGHCSDPDDAFRKFISDHGSCYIPNKGLSCQQAIELIRDAGGVAIIAHPSRNKRDPLIRELRDEGLQGIEAYHPSHTPYKVQYYLSLSEELKMVVSGGSDCHGLAKGKPLIGQIRITQDELDSIKNCCEKN